MPLEKGREFMYIASSMIVYIVIIWMGTVVAGDTENDVPLWEIKCNTFENVTRAVGSNFSVSLVSACDVGPYGCEKRYVLQELHPGTDVGSTIKIAVVNAAATGQETGDRVAYYYAYNQIGTVRNMSVIFNLTIETSDLPATIRLLSRGRRGCSRYTLFAWISFKGCENTMLAVSIRNDSIARYLDVVDIVCPENGRAIFNNGSMALQTQCLINTTWRDADNVICLYPISASLVIRDKPYQRTLNLEYIRSASDLSNLHFFKCSAKRGRLISDVAKFLVREQMINTPIIRIHPELNGANVSCYFENNFTNYFPKSTSSYLSTSTLNISFGPYPPKGVESLCSFPNGSIRFYSNPPEIGYSSTLFDGENEIIAADVIECCEISYGVSGQMITPRGNITERGNFTLRTNHDTIVEYYAVVPCEDDATITGTTAIPTTARWIAKEAGESEVMLLSSLSVVAGLLLIILIGCLVWERRIKSHSALTTS